MASLPEADTSMSGEAGKLLAEPIVRRGTERQSAQPSSNPLVSIVLPVYNDEGTVDSAVDSLLSQSYKNTEVIVVDDGSTDNSRAAVRSRASRDDRVRLIETQHAGTSSAKNSGFASSKGEVVFFAEGDAVYDPDYLELALECLRENPGVGGVCVLGGPLVTRETFVTKSMVAEKCVQHRMIHLGRRGPYFAWVFTRSALEKVGLYDSDLSQSEDTDLFNRVKAAGFKIGLVEGVRWRHRRNETTSEFVRKVYSKGKRKVAYLRKKGLWGQYLKGVVLLWVPVVMLVASIWIPTILWILLLGLLLGLGYRYYWTLRVGLQTQADTRDLILVPIFQSIRYYSNAIGFSAGAKLWLRGNPTERKSVTAPA